MKLSEAILAGAKLKPQAFGVTNSHGHTCALGAALEGAGQIEKEYTSVFTYFPLASLMVEHPIISERLCMLSAIRELNDEYRWTRERIAKFVATYEPAQAVDAVGEASE